MIGKLRWPLIARFAPTRHLAEVSRVTWQLCRDGRTLAAVAVASFAVQIMTIAVAWCLAQSVAASASFTLLLYLIPPVLLIATVPVSIAGWGVREGSMIVAFAYAGLAQGDGLIVSVLYRACHFRHRHYRRPHLDHGRRTNVGAAVGRAGAVMGIVAGKERSKERILTALALLWLSGCALRLTILAVPPVIPLIHDELNLSATQVGILTGLPSMLFAIAAVPGSLLIARLGVRSALVVGMTIAAHRRRAARADAGRAVALRHDDRDGRRRRHHAGDHAAGGARLGAEPHRLCDRRLHQRPAGRRNSARRLHADAGAADGRHLAMGLCVLERAGRHHRARRFDVGAARGKWRLAGANANGGRTGATC